MNINNINNQTPAKLRGKMWPPFGVSLSLSFWSPRSKQIHVVDSAIRFSSKGEQKKLRILKIQKQDGGLVNLLILVTIHLYSPPKNCGIPVGRQRFGSQGALPSDAHEARTLREKFTKIGVARLG